MEPIPDYLKKNLDILFVGFNPSIRSSETGFHYANPTNRFWKILHEAGLTPRKFKAEENATLLGLGYGLTNIVPRPTKDAAAITKEEYYMGAKMLKEKIEKYKPKIACFVGKGVYLQYSGKRAAPWGLQEDPIVAGTIDFVAPSSSGLVRIKMEDIAVIYRELHELLLKA
ncbi:G/U mismatch-specific DNA glycosylase [Planomicrobium sp. YIM 101495]|uniref:G/U mismatch-specific DNA glycosylase n=1 Tax=Planomicrobium sp. YIM 101495 TaxID=2665160 RepID=UPI0012B8A26C|nr:G/U mismatch-specific DNA glycosylase [Planomicrobium sp. YIM 101495]MTD31275.1 G/U mismatch-specific DNA glycosylase [Planomicrobium sp. YIM 101495]